MTGHATRVLRALVAAIVPETPELAADRGPEHRPGGTAAGVHEHLVETLGDDAVAVALALEVAAVELIVRRARSEPFRWRAGGLSAFASLTPVDRRRAVDMLEADGLVPWLDARLGGYTRVFDELRELGHVLPVLVMFSYYAGAAEPESPQAWEQTGYPGPADGYATACEYEVESFVEDEY